MWDLVGVGDVREPGRNIWRRGRDGRSVTRHPLRKKDGSESDHSKRVRDRATMDGTEAALEEFSRDNVKRVILRSVGRHKGVPARPCDNFARVAARRKPLYATDSLDRKRLSRRLLWGLSQRRITTIIRALRR